MHEMRIIVTDVPVARCVCASLSRGCAARIEMLFGDLRLIVLYGCPHRPTVMGRRNGGTFFPL